MWIAGWGETDAIAHSRWRNAIRNLVLFFGKVSEANSKRPVGLTVSQHMRIMEGRSLPDQEIPTQLDHESDNNPTETESKGNLP
jgi:hypothetical protein